MEGAVAEGGLRRREHAGPPPLPSGVGISPVGGVGSSMSRELMGRRAKTAARLLMMGLAP